MAVNVSMEENFRSQVELALARTINDVREQVLRDAIEKFDREVRHRVSLVALEVSRFFSLQRMGNDLMITVKFDGPAKE